MGQKTLGKWLKMILAGLAICGIIVYFIILPGYGSALAGDYPEFACLYWPWLIFLWLTAIPCYAALVFGWRIASNIGRDRSFSMENARLLTWISWLAAGDCLYFFLGNIAFLAANASHPGVVILALLVIFAGIAVAVAAAVLSHLVQKAAALQEESDLTI